MIDAKKLIHDAQKYGAKLKRVDHQNIQVVNGESLPLELIQQLKAHKQILLQYLEQSFLDIALMRAYHGYFWLAENNHNHEVTVEQWRLSIGDVIGLSKVEVSIIENLLVQSNYFSYSKNGKYLLSTNDHESSQDWQKIHDWVHTPQRYYFKH